MCPNTSQYASKFESDGVVSFVHLQKIRVPKNTKFDGHHDVPQGGLMLASRWLNALFLKPPTSCGIGSAENNC